MHTSIEDLVSVLKQKLPDYLQENDIAIDINKPFACLHPDHKDQNPSMRLGPGGSYVKCFSCNAVADIFTVVNWLEQRPLTGPEFVTDNIFYLAKRYGIDHDLVGKNGFAPASNRESYFRAYRLVAEYIVSCANDNPNELFIKETRKRKWNTKDNNNTAVTCQEVGVGCVKSFYDVKDLLNRHGFEDDMIKDLGLNRPDLFNPDGLIFTIYDENGRPIAFYMRDIRFEEKKAEHDKRLKAPGIELSKPNAPIKYNSTANTPANGPFRDLYEKSLAPYGIHDIKSFHEIYVVEGHGCKLSLRLQGERNVIAIGGLELSDVTINKIGSLGVTSMVLMLDNDRAGRNKVKNIIRKFYSRIPMDLFVIDMGIYSDAKDPDELIRKYGIDAFKSLQKQNALEWLVADEIEEKGDPYTVLQDIVPLIAADRSPINRLKVVNTLADITKISREIIQEEVDQKISVSKDRKGEYALKVIREAQDMIINNPMAVDAAKNLIDIKLSDLNRTNTDEDLFSGTECLKSLLKLQEREDSGAQDPVIRTGYVDFDKNVPIPASEAFTLIMAPPNTGKSSFIINKALREIEHNTDHMVIILTNDDSRDVYIRRMVAALAKIKINWVENPKYFLDADKMKARMEAYTKIGEYMRNDRLIIKDVSHGNSVEYYGRLISHYRDKYENRTISCYCDNLHRLDSEAGYEDMRIRVKAISGLMKSYTTKFSCSNTCTVEMTKEGMYDKPKDARTISEAASLQFDANLIIYLWNDINARREEAELFFESTTLDYLPEAGYVHKPNIKPVIEALILKNKLSEYKGSLYFAFHPELAIYDDFSTVEAERIMNKAKIEKAKKAAENKAAHTQFKSNKASTYSGRK